MSELVPADTLVLSVSATDRDSGLNGEISYRLLSSPLQGFYIQPDNGKNRSTDRDAAVDVTINEHATNSKTALYTVCVVLLEPLLYALSGGLIFILVNQSLSIKVCLSGIAKVVQAKIRGHRAALHTASKVTESF